MKKVISAANAKTKRQIYMKSYNRRYFRTKNGLVRKIYHHIKRNIKHRNHEEINFTFNELCEWIFRQDDFQKLFKEWVHSNYSINYTPSIDRIDNNYSYFFKNIQLVSWYQNKENAYFDIRNRNIYNSQLLNGGHKNVIQFNINGEKLKEFLSVSDASRKTYIPHQNISRCCRQEGIISNGFLWCYKDNESNFIKNIETTIIKAKQILKSQTYKILKQDLHTSNTIDIYQNMKEACEKEAVSFKVMTKWINNIKTGSRTKEKKFNYIKEYQ